MNKIRKTIAALAIVAGGAAGLGLTATAASATPHGHGYGTTCVQSWVPAPLVSTVYITPRDANGNPVGPPGLYVVPNPPSALVGFNTCAA